MDRPLWLVCIAPVCALLFVGKYGGRWETSQGRPRRQQPGDPGVTLVPIPNPEEFSLLPDGRNTAARCRVWRPVLSQEVHKGLRETLPQAGVSSQHWGLLHSLSVWKGRAARTLGDWA